jgi:2-polyprenyl-3-methyl-5-hydroxy-6-metoxy-1,4-benzoquinol methylase
MFDYEDIADRFWNLPQKGTEEKNREEFFIDDIIQKAHIEKEILNNLEGVSTVFDGGAGSGRFSIFLAKRGIKVTHFDISDSMIETARETAKSEGVLDKIEFVKGRLGELSQFRDNSFDLVISIDAPISYTYPNQEDVIKNLVRISNCKVLFSVSSRLGSLPYLLNPIQKAQYILDKDSTNPLVQWYNKHSEEALNNFKIDTSKLNNTYQTGLFEEAESTADSYQSGKAPWPVTYQFMPDELVNILTVHGVADIQLAGPGAFARSIPNEVLVKIMNDPKSKKEFLDFCYQFDKQPWVAGLGKDNLLSVGRKIRIVPAASFCDR